VPETPPNNVDQTAGTDVILGVDPGLQRTGYAILSSTADSRQPSLIEAGVIHLAARTPLEARLGELERCLAGVLDAHAPGVLVCEELYAHYKHPRTAILMGHARGVILALGARRGLAVISVAATQVKRTLTGSGHAGKAQVQRAVAMELGLPKLPEPHDVADAIAIGLCGLQIRREQAHALAFQQLSPREQRKQMRETALAVIGAARQQLSDPGERP
jgi:crossover junction endodeoxyribonuclease RuvC